MPIPIQLPVTAKRDLQFGIYRDGDNNLDEAQAPVLDQAQATSQRDPRIAFNVEDTTERDDDIDMPGEMRTEEYNIIGGQERDISFETPKDMSDRKTLTKFVAQTLDQAECNHASQTWLDLVDHGGGDGGAFQTNISGGHVMCEDDIAGAIADGIRMHGEAHPEDVQRGIDGVLFNACLMANCGMADALSHVGVQYLAASPETMIAPGAPSGIAEDIVNHESDPSATAKAIVAHTMRTHYGIGGEHYGPAAAFDVLNLDPKKIAAMESSIKALNEEIVSAARVPSMKAAIKADGRDVEGMTRSQGSGLPWQADRPAEELYGSLASDPRLSDSVRDAAQKAEEAVADLVMAHGESRDFAPFGDESYRDAVGPTVHFPTSHREIDPWAPAISETNNAFALKVAEQAAARALA